MSDFLFDTPYWVFAAIVVVAAGLLIQGNVRQNKRLKWAALGALLLGVVLALLSYSVDTDKKKCIKRTRQLIEAVQDRQTDVLKDTLSQSVTLGAWDRDDILAGYTHDEDTYGVKEIKISSLQAVQYDSVVTITLDVMVRIEANSFSSELPSTWRLDWQQSADGWHLTRIHLVEIDEGATARDGKSVENLLFGQHVPGRAGGAGR